MICRQIEEEYSRKKSELELGKKQLEEEHRKRLEFCQRYFSESVIYILQQEIKHCLDLIGNWINHYFIGCLLKRRQIW